MKTIYSERIDEILEDFNKFVVPSEESAKFAEKLLIGEMQGHLIALENFKYPLNITGGNKWKYTKQQ